MRNALALAGRAHIFAQVLVQIEWFDVVFGLELARASAAAQRLAGLAHYAAEMSDGVRVALHLAACYWDVR